GKGKVYLNGSLSQLSALKSIVAPLITLTGRQTPLIEMTGQHDNRHLQSKSYHLEILDTYAGTWTQRQEYAKVFKRLNEVQSEIWKTPRNRASNVWISCAFSATKSKR